MNYQFTSDQLVRLLQKTCALYETCRDMGANPSAARLTAIGEVLDGLEPADDDDDAFDPRPYITERLDYLTQQTYHHECNIAQPDADEQYAYYAVLGEQRALQAVQRVMEGGKA